MVGPASCRDRVLALLKDQKVQENLAELFDKYWVGFQPVFRVATAEKNGVRPDNVTNEMFSCLHHVARGLCDAGTELDPVDPTDEIRKAIGTHIKRATLDSYKIAINGVLAEDTATMEILDYVLLADDNLGGNFKDRVDAIIKVKQLKRECRTAYVKAKSLEAGARWSAVIAAYSAAMEKAQEIRTALADFYEDPVTVSFLAREGRRRDELKQNKKHDFRKSVTIAIITAIITGSIVSFFNYFNNNSAKAYHHESISSDPLPQRSSPK